MLGPAEVAGMLAPVAPLSREEVEQARAAAHKSQNAGASSRLRASKTIDHKAQVLRQATLLAGMRGRLTFQT